MLKERIYKFSARNVSMSTFSGFNCARDGVLISPTLLNNRSDGELLAWIARYFRATWQSSGRVPTSVMSHTLFTEVRWPLTHQTFLSRFSGSSSFSGFFGSWTLAKPKNRFFKKTGIFRYTEKPPQPTTLPTQFIIKWYCLITNTMSNYFNFAIFLGITAIILFNSIAVIPPIGIVQKLNN